MNDCCPLTVDFVYCSDLKEQFERARILEEERRRVEEEAARLEAERQAALMAKEELARQAEDQMKTQEQLVSGRHLHKHKTHLKQSQSTYTVMNCREELLFKVN